MNYIITGKVIHGDGYGKKIGFPTVNLETDIKEFPPEGVYAGLARLDDKEYRAGIVIGPKKEQQHKIDAHLLGYSGDAYDKVVTLELKKFIREYKNFDTEEELIKQITEDMKLC